MSEFDNCRERFEKAFPVPAHWIEFDEKANRYFCPYVADPTASAYQSKWVVWQHQQAKVEEANAKAQMCRDEKNHAINRWTAVCKERDELQKRVDATRQVFEKSRNGCFDPHDLMEELEQALMGEKSK
ncbi:hypothetical protein [Acinetobacter baumannii]|uniref:hypothetical protein n=1 Tax=Acinetobacter baumannii TaxID=470 RepID=UPI000D6E7A1D|nr:hypothetical protein [Acinetobacter baumannii]